jgi:hypothetical protein
MKTTFKSRNDNIYVFLSDGNNVLMNVKCGDIERTYSIKVNNVSGFAFKLNKRTISADNGAEGLVSFIKRCARHDINMLSVYSICNFIAMNGKRA